MNFFSRSIFAAAPGVISGAISNGPWRAKSFLAAVTVALAGLGLWCSDAIKSHPATGPNTTASDTVSSGIPGAQSNWNKPVPGYVRVCVSYMGGFLLGWVFRRFIKIAAAGTALIIALLALGRHVGCDTTRAQDEVKRDSAWAQREAIETSDYLRGRLPSAAAGGTGVLFGFRRKSKTTASEPPKPPVDGPAPVP